MLNWLTPKLILLSALIALLACNGQAQVAFHNFNSNDGLPSNEVYCVYQDHDGYMWFATDHGIIKGDEENRIWVLTLSGGDVLF